MPGIEDQFKPIAYQYGAVEKDEEKSRYELAVNWPSIKHFLPEPPLKVLDYGCGSGVYTRKLLKDGYDATGVDNAPDMLAQAGDIADRIKVWSYQDDPLKEVFDVGIAKLVVQFIEDLPAFAAAIRRQLHQGGLLIVSVPHPDRSRQLLKPGQQDGVYPTEVGTSGLRVNMIHRELSQYENIFDAMRFKLVTTEAPIDQDNPDAEPKHLNMLLEAVV